MPGPGPRNTPAAVPNTKGPGAAKSFTWVLPLGQNGVDPAALIADVGVLTLAGFAPTLAVSDNQAVTPGAGALTVTGVAPAVVVNVIVTSGVGALPVAGFAPAVVASDSQTVLAGVGALTVAGLAPTVTVSDSRLVTAGVGTLAVDGLAPIVVLGTVSVPDGGTLSLAGFTPDVVATQNAVLTPDVGFLALTGSAPDVQGDPVTTLPGGGWMQPIRHAKAERLTIWSYEEFAPTVTITAPTFRAVVLPRPVVVTADTGVIVCAGHAPDVAVSISQEERVTHPLGIEQARRAPFPVYQPEVQGHAQPTHFSGRPEEYSTPAPPAPAPALAPVAAETTPAQDGWVAAPVTVRPSTGTLALNGYAPQIDFGRAWTPEVDDDDAAILLGLMLLEAL